MKEKKRLGEILTDLGLIDDLQLAAALGYQEQWGERLGSILVKMGFVTEQDIVSILEKQIGYKSISIVDKVPDTAAMALINADTAKKYSVFPIAVDGKVLTLAMTDPTDLKTIDDLGFKLGMRIKPELAMESDITRAIARHYEGVEVRQPPRNIASTERERVLDQVKLQNAHTAEAVRSDEELSEVDVPYEPEVSLPEPGGPPSVAKAPAEPVSPEPEKVPSQAQPVRADIPPMAPKPSSPDDSGSFGKREDIITRRILDGLMTLLIQKGVITKEELIQTIRNFKPAEKKKNQ